MFLFAITNKQSAKQTISTKCEFVSGIKVKQATPKAAFVFIRDNKQTVCEADSKHEVRVCEWNKSKTSDVKGGDKKGVNYVSIMGKAF